MEIKHFYWLPTPTAWQEAEAWRGRRQALAQETLNAGDAANSIFSTAATDQINGLAKLAAQAAVKRIKMATKTKLDKTLLQFDSALGGLGKSDTASKTTKVDKKA
jgi:hypothetical protein